MSQPPLMLEPPPTASPDAARRTWPTFRRWAFRRLLALAVLLALYVLSIGPMWWVWYSGMYVETESNYWVIAIYEPLRQACRIEWVDSVVTGYIEWWNL